MWYLQKDKLKANTKYLCEARNFTVGTWNGKEFEYKRKKFGGEFVDTELHYDDCDVHGTVKPIMELPLKEL